MRAFIEFTMQPVQEWARSAYFYRDLTLIGIGVLLGLCIGVWVICPRCR